MRAAGSIHVSALALLIGAMLSWSIRETRAQDLAPYYFDIGTPTLTEIYIDPRDGSDSRAGTSPALALRTVREAWNRIPSSQTLTTGYRLNLSPGVYGDDPGELPSYWELKRGTASAPVIIQPTEGPGTVSFTTDINMANVSYFYLLNISINRGGDVFHCEACDHILLRGNTLIGAPMGRTSAPVAHETIKFNQSQYVYIENNFISGADDNAIDWVAVQYGHIVGNRISDSQSWCTYVKGGSAYVRIEANEFYNCFEGGVTAGQGTGLEFMVAPWFRYEAYDIKIINNIIHDITGAALGVNGGYNVLLAHNTAYRVGSRSHLVEIVYGLRSCDGDVAACAARVAEGAWGPTTMDGDNAEPIGNNKVKLFNNIIYNPSDYPTNDQHFTIQGPRVPTAGSIPSPQRTDVDVEIKGNIIWNGSPSHSLGIEGSEQGCQPSNTSCNSTQIVSDNSINVFEPALRDPANGDFRPASGGNVTTASASPLTAFAARDGGETTPEGALSNSFLRDYSGASSDALLVGAFASPDSSLSPPGNTGSNTPTDPDAPTITNLSLRAKKVGRLFRVSVKFRAADNGSIRRATARLSNRKRIALTRKGSTYLGNILVRRKRGLSVTVSVTDNERNTTTTSRQVR